MSGIAFNLCEERCNDQKSSCQPSENCFPAIKEVA
jgi:hypothetical protein